MNETTMKEASMNDRTALDRRQFLGLGAAVTALAATSGLMACSPQDSGSTGDQNTGGTGGTGGTPAQSSGDGKLPWLPAEPQIAEGDVEAEVEAEVIVIGCGTAGVAAVRSAAEEGVNVVAFEKAAGPVCRSGEFAVVNGKLEARWGRETFDTDMLADHEMDECSYFPKRRIWSKWLENGADVIDWYIAAKEDLFICDTSDQVVPEGIEASLAPIYHPLPPLYDWKKETHPCYPTSVTFSPSHEPVLLANMDKAVAEGDVEAFWGHFVEKLIMDGDRCVGCYARNASSGKYVKATASKGVVLATGEYASNPEIIEYYCPDVIANNVPSMWMNVDVEGNPTNTGDGLKLGAWVNAAIQQHHAPMIHHMGGRGGNDMAGAMGVMGINPFLRLDKDGKRFMNEDCPGQQTENQIEVLRDRTAYMIWDGKWAEQLKYFPAAHGLALGVTQDALQEAVASGGTLQADSLDALLDAIGDIDKVAAKASVERYSRLAKNGKDEDYGKEASRLFPLETPPFYCSTLGVAPMLVCIGGLESDEECHVYSNERKAIPGLYAAGNIQGNRYAVQYPIALKGASHAMALYYGYVAGKNAAASA
jgi:succinate dehydrogenase/fumarate reductase flavoprotein subunit